MRIPILASLTISLLTPALPPQEAPTPAPELAKYDRLIGNFTGAGKVWFTPDAPPGDWTSTIAAAKALGDFFVREDAQIDLGEAAPGPLRFRTFYGYDGERARHVAWSLSNMGEVAEKEIHWAGDKMITVGATVRDGQPMLERWEIVLADDGYTMVGYESVGDGPWFKHVTGRYHRVHGNAAPDLGSTGAPFVPPAEAMRRFDHLTGTYQVAGKMAPAPEMPAQPFSGTETYGPLWGHSLYEMAVHGDPGPFGTYEGYGALGWDPRAGCYTSLWVDNMGQASLAQARWNGDDLVFTSAASRADEAVLERSVLQCGEHGVIAMTGDLLWGRHPAYTGFEARFERQGQ